MVFLCTLATKRAKISSIYSKITKVGGMFKVFQLKTIPYMFKDFSQKSDLLERHTPVCLTPRIPPPPPGAEYCVICENYMLRIGNLGLKSWVSRAAHTQYAYMEVPPPPGTF